jgi:uncharacterized protein YcfJ
MLKRVFIISVIVALTGCATHQQSNELAGAVIGGAVGNRVGGVGGAILGAGMGAAIGGQQPTYRYNQPIYVERYGPRYQCQQYIDRERNCWNLRYGDTRAMCIEDARLHYRSCLYR